MSKRILFAHSDHAFQESLSRLLIDEQVETVCTGDGKDALFLLNETDPDLLIAEFALPNKDGYELCRYVREEPDFQSLPVVLLDNQYDSFNQNVANGVGANLYLSEPINPRELKDVVGGLLENGKEDFVEEPVYTAAAAENQYAPALESYGFAGPAPALDEAPSFAVPQQAQTSSKLLPWALLAAVVLVAAGLALLDRGSDLSSPPVQKQALTGGQVAEEAPLIEAQPEKVSSEHQEPPARNSAVASLSEASVAQRYPGEDKDLVVSVPSPPISSPEPTEGSDAAAPESAAEPVTPSINGSTDASNDPVYTAPTRPRYARMGRSNTAGAHIRRGGLEMKKAGSHLGNGAKHLGLGSGKATVWAGSKLGRGVKRVGTAFKRLF